ncbi:MAG: hypothetical protein L3J56_04270 [Bacteroidales bacterium]|nr:hypothetical protein [Bacteroidales bacterium]
MGIQYYYYLSATIFALLGIYLVLIKIYKKQLKGRTKRMIKVVLLILTMFALILMFYFLSKYMNNIKELSEISKNINNFETMKKYVDLMIISQNNLQSAFFSFILSVSFPTIAFVLKIISEIKDKIISLLKKK